MTQVLESLDWHDIQGKKNKKKHNWMLFFPVPVTTVASSFLKNQSLLLNLKSMLNFKVFFFLNQRYKALCQCSTIPPQRKIFPRPEQYTSSEDECCGIKRYLQKTSLEVGSETRTITWRLLFSAIPSGDREKNTTSHVQTDVDSGWE